VSETIRVFVNAGMVDLPAGSDVGSAVRAFDPELDRQMGCGAAYVTDGRGIEVSPDAPLAAGAILRVVIRSRKGTTTDADT
jgi:hypothetical protein